ncbi:hypothetical protein ANN_13946 [Periplaneta americana]|uniref:DUF4817 domain-containing protein n=1 Tax=Periplaneta americana TaxID=6978 RepID=A0ABQ8SWF6_PERAM|nr:hypothetical protein ANN_13946 [Periplaneta americana]
MKDAFRTEGYHIEEYLLSMGLDERLGIAKEGGNKRSANRPYFGCCTPNKEQPRATLPNDERDSSPSATLALCSHLFASDVDLATCNDPSNNGTSFWQPVLSFAVKCRSILPNAVNFFVSFTNNVKSPIHIPSEIICTWSILDVHRTREIDKFNSLILRAVFINETLDEDFPKSTFVVKFNFIKSPIHRQYFRDFDFDLTSKWADNRQATNIECTLTLCDLNCGFLLTNSDVYYANQTFSKNIILKCSQKFQRFGNIVAKTLYSYTDVRGQRTRRSESVTAVQRAFRRKFNVTPPTKKSIYHWNKQFDENGSLNKGEEQLFVRDRAYLLVFRTEPIRVQLPYVQFVKKVCKSSVGVNIHNGKAHPQQRRDKIVSQYYSPSSNDLVSDNHISNTNINDPLLVLVSTSPEQDNNNNNCNVFDAVPHNSHNDNPMQQREDRISQILSDGNTDDLELLTKDLLNFFLDETTELPGPQHPAIRHYKNRKLNAQYKYNFQSSNDPVRKSIRKREVEGKPRKNLNQKHTRIRLYNTLARPMLSNGSEAWTLRKADKSRITACEMRFMRRTAVYTKWDLKINFHSSSKQNQARVYSQSRLTVIVNSTELVSILRSRIMFAFSSDKRAFNIESYFRTEVKIDFTIRKYHRTPVMEGGSKRCFRFSTVNQKMSGLWSCRTSKRGFMLLAAERNSSLLIVMKHQLQMFDVCLY